MSDDPTSLDRLHDLAIPPPVPWWPPTPGWWLVLATVCIVLTALLLKAFIRWQADRYRREAIALLDDPALLPCEWSRLLKRAALVVWPREEVAALTGPAWLAFLDRTGGTNHFTRGSGRFIEAVAFGSAGDADLGGLKQAARAWLTDHRKEAAS